MLDAQKFAHGQIIIGLKEGLTEKVLDENIFLEIEVVAVKVLAKSPPSRRVILLLILPQSDREGTLQVIALLKKNPYVAYAEPNFMGKIN